MLKKTLDEVVSTYPRLSAPGAGTGGGGGASTGADGPRAAEDAEREVRIPVLSIELFGNLEIQLCAALLH